MKEIPFKFRVVFWTILVLIIAIFVVAINSRSGTDAKTTEQDYQTPSQYRFSIPDKFLGIIGDSNLFHDLFEDIDIFEKDKKFLWIVPGVEMFRSGNLFDKTESESLPAIKITYDLSYLHGETYIFEFYAEYKHSSVFYASAELTFIQDGKLTTRPLIWSNDTGGNHEIKKKAETIYRWWKNLASRN